MPADTPIKDGDMPDVNLAPVYLAPADYDHTAHRPVRGWVLNPDGHLRHGAFVGYMARTFATRKTITNRALIMGVTLAVGLSAGAYTATQLGHQIVAIACVGAAVLSFAVLYNWPLPKVRLGTDTDVARVIRAADTVHIGPSQMDVLTREGFGSPAHRALWAGLVARDDADQIDRVVEQTEHADPQVRTAARRIAGQLREDQARAYRTFTDLITQAQMNPDQTAALRDVLDRAHVETR